MLRSKPLYLALFAIFAAACAAAQVLSPAEIQEPSCRSLQQRYFAQLKQVGEQIRADHFAFPFYLSTVLDIDPARQPAVDQRSIRFGRFDGRHMLEISGNYYASYSAAKMDRAQRVRRTFTDVVMPLLNAAVPRLTLAPDFQGFAIEVSHHVRKTVLGVDTESAENLAFILPREAASKLVAAKGADEQQSALLDSDVFVDGEPFLLWLRDDAPPPDDWQPRHSAPAPAKKRARVVAVAETSDEPSPAAPADATGLVNPRLLGITPPPLRVVNADTLGRLDAKYMDVLPRMVHELSQANFVGYAPPSFISFHNAAYLELPMATTIASPADSQYRLAALAFDQQVAHLVRGVLTYFKESSDFDGVNFSVTVNPGNGDSKSALSVEYMIPLSSLRCYASYDCTGQQMLNSAIILINGDRISLDLQKAEETRGRE